MLLLLVASALACESSLSAQQLREQTAAVLALYEAYEIPRFLEAARKLEAEVPCAGEPVDPALAAQLHVAVGLLRWKDNARDQAALAWTAARIADPGFTPSEALFPADSAERALWEGIQGRTGGTRPLPSRDRWWLDGQKSTTIATDRPTVAQSLDTAGVPARSSYAWPGADWPPTAIPDDNPRKVRVAPLVTGALSLAMLGTGAALLGSAYVRSQDDDFQAECPDLWTVGSCPASVSDDFRSRYTNSFYPSWYGGLSLLGVGAAGLAGSSIWLAVSPTKVAVGGTF